MKALLVGAVVVATLAGAAPASAQSIGIGPDGPRIDLRNRAERERDEDRRAARRAQERREMDRRDRYEDDRRMDRRRMRRGDEY